MNEPKTDSALYFDFLARLDALAETDIDVVGTEEFLRRMKGLLSEIQFVSRRRVEFSL